MCLSPDEWYEEMAVLLDELFLHQILFSSPRILVRDIQSWRKVCDVESTTARIDINSGPLEISNAQGVG